MDNTSDIELRTPAQRAKEERSDAICSDFLTAYKAHPEATPHRIICGIADKYGLTDVGVKAILTKRGIYKVNGGNPQILTDGGSEL
ncbi:MAG: hypothetical protein IKX67_07355 [Bacteroidales bacterium]|nr:hypothetical protein [Bacteroidales bacterium]